jgi:carbonic anhydrase
MATNDNRPGENPNMERLGAGGRVNVPDPGIGFDAMHPFAQPPKPPAPTEEPNLTVPNVTVDPGVCQGQIANSPIALQSAWLGENVDLGSDAAGGNMLKTDYQGDSDHATMRNDGLMLRVNLEGGEFGKILMGPDRGDFRVKEFTFQFPSDHTIDGDSFAGELQILHERNGSYVVVSVLLEEGEMNEETKNLFAKFRYAVFGFEGQNKEMLLHHEIDLNDLSKQYQGRYWAYSGALPYPPCPESVIFIVLARSLKVDKSNLDDLRKVYDSNNFKIRDLAGRSVSGPKDWSQSENVETVATAAEGDADGAGSAAAATDGSAALHGGPNYFRASSDKDGDGRAATGAETNSASLTPA